MSNLAVLLLVAVYVAGAVPIYNWGSDIGEKKLKVNPPNTIGFLYVAAYTALFLGLAWLLGV